MSIDEFIAREEIRALMAVYNMGGDSARPEEFASVFAEDAVLETTGLRLEGRENIVNGIFSTVAEQKSSRPGPRFVRHHLSTSKITFSEPGIARGRTYFHVLTDIGLDHAGVYMDRFRKEADGWKIAHRKVTTEYQAADSYFSPRE